MAGRTIDGRAIARRVEDRVRARIQAAAHARAPPRLDVVLVGDDPASLAYVGRKEEACRRVGIEARVHRLPATTKNAELVDRLEALNRDASTTGVLLQLPLPTHLATQDFLSLIDPRKDVDCFHPLNLGRAVQGNASLWPATPMGVITILEEEGVPLRGAHAVVINHSNLIGRPLAALLLQRDATVTVCHKHTRDLPALTRQADVLITGTGVPDLVRAEHVRPGAVVIDVGIARHEGKIRGDVAFEEVLEVAQAVTPVPGGVGPLTVAMLLANVATAYESGASRR